MNAEPDFLASAYLDGELTAEERRVAEADPAVMAEVAELRALREAIADVPPPTDAVREAAIAAAMGAFRSAPTAATTAVTAAPAGRILAFRRRPRYEVWLGFAAAVLVIGLLGVVIATAVRPGDGGDDAADDLTAAEVAADEPASEPASEPADEPAAEAASDRIAESAPAPAGAEADDGSFDTAIATADEPAEEMAEVPAAAEMAVIDPASYFTFDTPPGATVPIETPEQLAAAAEYLRTVEAEGRLGSTPNTSCGPALARAEALEGDVVVPVLVMITDDGLVSAVTDECTVVLATELQP